MFTTRKFIYVSLSLVLVFGCCHLGSATKSNSSVAVGLRPHHYFRLPLRNEQGQEMALTFELEHHSVAKKFVRISKKVMRKPNYEIRYTAWGIYPAGDHIITELLAKLQSHIDYFDSHNKAGLKFEHKVPSDFKSVTRIELNNIHSDFERLISTTYTVPTGDHNKLRTQIILNGTAEELTRLESALNSVNGLVHALEHVVSRGSNSYDSFFTTYLYGSKILDIPLSTDEYKLFTLDLNFGDLLLGYGTTGKSLYHLYKDNDVALLNAGGRPSPQRIVSTNILGWFGQYINGTDQYRNMMSWLEHHRVGERLGLNVTDITHGHGYIRLGRLVRPVEWEKKTENEIVAAISPFHEILGYKLYR